MKRFAGTRRLIVSAVTTVAVAMAMTVADGTPAQAVDVPAYGIITISNQGLGFGPTWTYDPAFWLCTTEVQGQFNAPTAVVVTCRAYEGFSFNCPHMILT